MFSKITNPIMDIYDSENRGIIGEASFALTSDAERQLIQLVNYGIPPKSLILLNFEFYQLTEGYTPPNLSKLPRQSGVLRAVFTDTDIAEHVPIEIRLEYDARVRGKIAANANFYNSVELYNIDIQSIMQVDY